MNSKNIYCKINKCLKLHPFWYHRCCYCQTHYNPDGSIVKNGKCRPCGNKASKASEKRHREERTKRRHMRYLKNPEFYKEKAKNERIKERTLALKAYGGEYPKCVCCGESQVEFLVLDHINNDGKIERKKYGTGNAYYRSLRKRGYPKGVQILCHNCNMAKEFYGECPHKLLKLKSGNLLLDFKNYCFFHPTERFWQSLLNWSGYSFIFGSKGKSYDDYSKLEDTFYFEGKNE